MIGGLAYKAGGIVKYSPRFAWLRRFTNLLYNDPHRVSLSLTDLGNDSYITIDGCKYYVRDHTASGARRVNNDPNIDALRPTDIVLDIGAYIGCVTIPMAKRAKRVYAVEPLFAQELQDNVRLNGLSNVSVIRASIAEEDVRYMDRAHQVLNLLFCELREEIGHIDFLKSNCEGGEWSIQPRHYVGIRELRVEFHISRVRKQWCEKRYNELMVWLRGNGYEVESVFAPAMSVEHLGSYRIKASLVEPVKEAGG